MTRKRARVINFYGGKTIMSDGESIAEIDFGEELSHVQSMVVNGIIIMNLGYKP